MTNHINQQKHQGGPNEVKYVYKKVQIYANERYSITAN